MGEQLADQFGHIGAEWFGRAEGPGDQHTAERRVVEQLAEQSQRRKLRPLQVIQQEGDRMLGGEVAQILGEPLEDREPLDDAAVG